MGKGGCTFKLICDEFFKEFKGFTDFLKQNKHYLNNPEQQPLKFRYNGSRFSKVKAVFLYVKIRSILLSSNQL
jgi:hypothetical protein